MKTSRFYLLFCVGALLAPMTSCGFKKEKIVATPPVKVTVIPVATSTDSLSRSYSGTVAAGEGSEVSFSIPGTVKAVYVTQGQKVTKGQLLAEVKSETLQNNYNMALATLNEAQDAYNRFKKLHDAKALADMRWVEVQNTLTQAQNAADIARRALDDAKIHAPVSGTVAAKMIDVGQTVMPAIPAVKVVALNDVKVTVSVPESEIGTLAEGTKARITAEALKGRTITGTLTEKAVEANPLTRAYEAKFAITNPDGTLLPGMLCTVMLEADSTVAASTVLPPQAVLLSADNRNFVWLAKNGKATRRFVEIGDMTAQGIVIASGIERGDSVITAGIQKVSEGTAVTPQL